MTRATRTTLLAAGASLAIAGAAWSQSGGQATGDEALIRSATSAAPEAVGRDATVIDMSGHGAPRVVRPGHNGFTCMADNPQTPGPDPMCMDANALAWAQAWMEHRTPPQAVGLMYMLAGGTDASNVDPYAVRPTSTNGWVHTGPHIMVVGSDSLLTQYPSGTNPDTTRPYVMFAGTPYAHLMIPIH